VGEVRRGEEAMAVVMVVGQKAAVAVAVATTEEARVVAWAAVGSAAAVRAGEATVVVVRATAARVAAARVAAARVAAGKAEERVGAVQAAMRAAANLAAVRAMKLPHFSPLSEESARKREVEEEAAAEEDGAAAAAAAVAREATVAAASAAPLALCRRWRGSVSRALRFAGRRSRRLGCHTPLRCAETFRCARSMRSICSHLIKGAERSVVAVVVGLLAAHLCLQLARS